MATLNRTLLKSTGKLALGHSRQFNTQSALSNKYATTLETTYHQTSLPKLKPSQTVITLDELERLRTNAFAPD